MASGNSQSSASQIKPFKALINIYLWRHIRKLTLARIQASFVGRTTERLASVLVDLDVHQSGQRLRQKLLPSDKKCCNELIVTSDRVGRSIGRSSVLS